MRDSAVRSSAGDGESVGAAAGFAALAIGVAAALVPLRDDLGIANAALLMVAIAVAAAAVGGRVAGVTTGLVASLAFNFFYTKPYLTLRIHSGRDVVTTALILVIGFGVGELGVARSRQSAARRSHVKSMRSLEQVGASVSAGASVEQVWAEVRSGLTSLLGVTAASFVAGDDTLEVPYIEHDGRIDVRGRTFVGNGFALPAGGVALAVPSDGARLGSIVVVPDRAVSVSREQRRAAAALADQLAIALRQAPPVRSMD